jgi:hypothetical protein
METTQHPIHWVPEVHSPMVMWLQPNADNTISSSGMHGARQPLQHTHERHVTGQLHLLLQWVFITKQLCCASSLPTIRLTYIFFRTLVLLSSAAHLLLLLLLLLLL